VIPDIINIFKNFAKHCPFFLWMPDICNIFHKVCLPWKHHINQDYILGTIGLSVIVYI